jgi:hypothetical protein
VTFAACRVLSATNFQCAICGWPEKRPSFSLTRETHCLGSPADRLLPRDQLADFLVLDPRQRGGIDLAALALRACVAQGRRTEQAADMVSPEGRLGALHGLFRDE